MTILADHPILHGDRREDDGLDLAPKMSAVFDILRHKNTQTPIAVAVYGNWGTGKSSAMRWLRDRLEQWSSQPETERGGHPAIETVWFDPWKYQTREDVWRGLIAEVILGCLDARRLPPKRLLEKIELAAKRFGAYVGRPFLAALSKIKLSAKISDSKNEAGTEVSGEAFTAVLDELRKVRRPHEPYLNEFESALRNWITDFFPQSGDTTPRRLALLIDDLDRCMPAVCLQVLEALKLYLNIPGLLFVVGLDRAVLEAVVCAEYAKHGVSAEKSRDYLAKMFQVQVDIAPTQSEARAFLKMQIGRLNDASGECWGNLLDLAGVGVQGRYRQIVESKIEILGSDNPREIKRLLNSILNCAWAAAESEKLGGTGSSDERRAERFLQGAQVFLVQRFLLRGYKREDLILRDDGQQFFERWSAFVRKRPGFRPTDRSREASPPDASAPEIEAAASGGAPRRSAQEGRRAVTEDAAQRHAEHEFEQLKKIEPEPQMLADRHLWDLMEIPFSYIVARKCAPQPIEALAAALAPASAEDVDAGDDASGGAGGAKPAKQRRSRASPSPLRVAIARALDKPVADVTEADAPAVTELDLSGAGITDLTPLAGLNQLWRLSLNQTGVADLTPLAGLNQLWRLSLNQTGVTDLTPLAGLNQLRELSLHLTSVTDLTPIVRLNQLQVLQLNQTGVTDLTPLAGLNPLQVLTLRQTGVADLTPLAGLNQLQGLVLDQTGVADLAPIAGLNQLRVLHLNETGVTDLTPIAGLNQLQDLTLAQTGVTDLTPLKKLKDVLVYIHRNPSLVVPPELEGRVRFV